MVNNKKVKGVKKAGKAEAGESSLASENSQKSGLSAPQLNALVFIALGCTWVLQYWSAASEGVGGKTCSEYYQNGESCKEVDAFVILTKFHSSIVSLLLVLSTMLLCWYDDKLLQSLNYFLCACPIIATFVTILKSESCSSGAIVAGQLSRVAFVSVALMALTVISAAVGSASMKKPQLNSLYDVSWISLALLLVVDAMNLVNGGVEGYANFSTSEVTDGSRCLVNFIAIDKGTIAALVAFGLYFLDEGRKNVMMFIFALANLGKLFFQLPGQESRLRDADAERTMLYAAAAFTGILSFLPSRFRTRVSTTKKVV